METVAGRAQEISSEYSPRTERPLSTYAGLLTTYQSGLAALVWSWRRSGRTLPERVGWSDVALLGIATHKLSRVIAKDKVTSVIRSPVTEYQEPGAPGEVDEKPRGRGVRLALGELLTCPYCLGPWVATSFVYGLLSHPRTTRVVASGLAALTISDFLQAAYSAAEKRV